MDSSEIKQLQILAAKSRMGAILGTYHAKSGHPGGSLSAADIFTYLYFKEMNVDPKNPGMQDRDRFVLSKGHCCPALYATLALKGFFEWDELTKLRHVGAMLQGHPDMKGTPGIDMSTGSLGQGVSAACGMALAAKLDNKSYRTYTVLGDGEVEEGQVWEAAMFAAHNKLDNLVVIVDQNGLQIDGTVEEVAGIEPLDKKFERASLLQFLPRQSRARAFHLWKIRLAGTALLQTRNSMNRLLPSFRLKLTDWRATADGTGY